MNAFIGLGNVDTQYANTKHNFGFWVVDKLVQRWNLSFRPGRGNYIYVQKKSGDVILAKPTLGMNRSGIPVKEIVRSWDIPFSNLCIILDDVDIPLGTMRIRPKGGDGCHRGMESVIYQLGDSRFPRIRIGIGTDENMRPAEKYVLKPFRKQDKSLAEEMVERGADAVEMIQARGIEKAMSEFN